MCTHTHTHAHAHAHTRRRSRSHAFLYIQVFLDGQRRQIEQRHEQHRFMMAEREAEKKNCVERTAACHHMPAAPLTRPKRGALVASVRRNWPGTHPRLEAPSGCLGMAAARHKGRVTASGSRSLTLEAPVRGAIKRRRCRHTPCCLVVSLPKGTVRALLTMATLTTQARCARPSTCCRCGWRGTWRWRAAPVGCRRSGAR